MKAFSLVTTLLAMGLIVPAHAAYAFDLGSVIEAAKENGTFVETHASASSGGQRAEGGESVQTGDVSASSHTEIISNDDGGSVKVQVETTENGKTNSKEYTAPIPKGEGVKVEANAEANDGTSSAEVKVNGEDVAPESQTASAAVSTHISLFFTEKIPLFLKKLFSFFS